MVDGDVDRLLRVVIDDCQALEPTTILETVTDKVHRPDLVRRQRHLERTTRHLHTLAIDRFAFATDQFVDASVAEQATLRSDRLDRLVKPTLVTVTGRPIPRHRAREPH
jgi:hypothetical protein